ncbi:hypothetical protein BGW80DRAFT_1258317 [Lactifluus volemus]|nr:hypothetical protein BGW80DRAFT_1258317 [Lactifluus volemus]
MLSEANEVQDEPLPLVPLLQRGPTGWFGQGPNYRILDNVIKIKVTDASLGHGPSELHHDKRDVFTMRMYLCHLTTGLHERKKMVQALPRHLVGWCGTYAGAELLLAGRNAGAAMKSNGTLDSTWDDRRLRRFIPHDLMCSLLAEPHHSEYMAHNQLSGEAVPDPPGTKIEVLGGNERLEDGRDGLRSRRAVGGQGRRGRRGHGPEFGTGQTVEGMKLAIDGRYEDDIEEFEGVVVVCGVTEGGRRWRPLRLFW